MIRYYVTFTVIGTVFCVLTLILSCRDITMTVPVSTESEMINDGDNVTADPFGYLNGKWNLWEYIGDSVSSMFQ